MDKQPRAPLYARSLNLKHIKPGGLSCFLLFEGAVGLAIVLALLGWVNWWGVAAIPVAIALMVKLNDVVAGRVARVH